MAAFGERREALMAAVGAKVLSTRRLVRLPILLYRLGLGRLFGTRLVMIQHTGRKSGQPRYVVLECVTCSAAGWPLIVSGFGEKAQWCQNVMADPAVRLWWGSRKGAPAKARRLSVEEGRAAVSAYAVEHPRAWKQLQPTFERILGEEITPESMTMPMFEVVPEP